jgi:hypothetical protein
VYDVQLALNDTGYVDLLEAWQQENCRLKLMAKRLIKNSALAPAYAKQKTIVANKAQLLKDFRQNQPTLQPVKAFVTMCSTEGAAALYKAYDVNFCLRWWSSHKYSQR